MYRAMAWYMLRGRVDLDDPHAIAALAGEPLLRSTTDPDQPTISVDGTDVSGPIRGAEVTSAVSAVAAVPEVRARLVELQRSAVSQASAAGRGIVVEGRDIGSVVLPDATAKIFLTADPKARAARRALEDAGRAGSQQPGEQDVSATAAALAARDAIDSGRAASPLRQADGSMVVDGTFLTLEEVIATIVDVVTEAARALPD